MRVPSRSRTTNRRFTGNTGGNVNRPAGPVDAGVRMKRSSDILFRVRVLVTGGAGFIGSHTVDRLVDRGDSVRVLDSLERPVHQGDRPPAWLHPQAEFLRGDVTRREDLLPALA